MTLWPFLLSAAELVGAIALIAALTWAAIERSKAHRWWRSIQHELGERDLRLPHWCAAVGTVAGCA